MRLVVVLVLSMATAEAFVAAPLLRAAPASRAAVRGRPAGDMRTPLLCAW